MEVLIKFVLVSLGLTYIVTDSEIFRPIKARIKSDFIWDLLSCPQCFGFWAGLGIGWIYGFNPIAGALMISGICFILTKLYTNES